MTSLSSLVLQLGIQPYVAYQQKATDPTSPEVFTARVTSGSVGFLLVEDLREPLLWRNPAAASLTCRKTGAFTLEDVQGQLLRLYLTHLSLARRTPPVQILSG